MNNANQSGKVLYWQGLGGYMSHAEIMGLIIMALGFTATGFYFLLTRYFDLGKSKKLYSRLYPESIKKSRESVYDEVHRLLIAKAQGCGWEISSDKPIVFERKTPDAYICDFYTTTGDKRMLVIHLDLDKNNYKKKDKKYESIW